MFETISNVDWSSLKQAHGTASHVPDALKDLISGDSEIEEKAYWKLDNHIVLQGDIYESAYYALPFLFEILNSNNTNGRDKVFDLLFEIANGYEAEEVSVEVGGNSLSLTDACRVSIVEEADLFLKEVSNKDSKYRSNALSLLMSLEEKFTHINHKLLEILKLEGDTEFKSELLEALDELN